LRPERAGGDSDEIALDQAPDICIEVTSPRNTTEEMTEKRRLLAGAGCREFWLCFDDGRMLFLDAVSGDPLDRSGLCPEFPTRTDIA
jgi:Uma2 family endonuclease